MPATSARPERPDRASRLATPGIHWRMGWARAGSLDASKKNTVIATANTRPTKPIMTDAHQVALHVGQGALPQ